MVECKNCGKETWKQLYLLKNNKRHFCSPKCWGVFRREHGQNRKIGNYNTGKIIRCEVCGIKTYKTTRDLEKLEHFYCSRKCFSTTLKKGRIVKCESCGKKTYKKLPELKNADHYFCSRECSQIFHSGENGPAWKGGVSFEPYDKEFNNKLKNTIRRRDNYQCQHPKCKKHQKNLPRKLDIHHIDGNKKHNHPNNLISLCQSCHHIIHGSSNFQYWKEFFHKIILKTFSPHPKLTDF